MKKILSVLLALSMLAVPVYANTGYTQEQLIEIAKEVCSIDDSYTDFEISMANEAYGNVFYSCQWTNESNDNSVDATIDSNGIVYGYNLYNSEELAKDKDIDSVLLLEKTSEFLVPFLVIIPLQLLAYEIALLRKCDIDKPRNLAKAVTVE